MKNVLVNIFEGRIQFSLRQVAFLQQPLEGYKEGKHPVSLTCNETKWPVHWHNSHQAFMKKTLNHNDKNCLALCKLKFILISVRVCCLVSKFEMLVFNAPTKALFMIEGWIFPNFLPNIWLRPRKNLLFCSFSKYEDRRNLYLPIVVMTSL